MELHYDFSHSHYMLGRERIPVSYSDYIYHIDEDGDYEILKKKYYQEALETAAYKYISEYANFISHSRR